MENYNNLLDSNIEYSNIVYGGAINTQMPQLEHEILPQNISEGTIILQNVEEAKDLPYGTRQTIITNNLQPQIEFEHQIQQQISHDGSIIIQTINQDTNQSIENFQKNLEEIQQEALTNGEETCQGQSQENNQQIEYLHCEDQKIDPIESENILETETAEPMDIVENEFILEKDTEINETKLKTEDNETFKDENVEPETELPNEGTMKTNVKKEDEIDPNQCRICLSKENLIEIFNFENNLRLCDKIMQICSTVKIIEKDFLPHMICGECVEKLNIAYEFKVLCETTDNELRKKLKRSKNKIRRPTEFILIDCDEFSESNSEDNIKNPDDDEFHISESMSEPDSSDSSFSIGKKKKVSRPKRRTPRKRSSTSSKKRTRRTTRKVIPERIQATPISKRPTRPQEIVLIKAEESEDDTPLQSRSMSRNKKRIQKISETKSIDYQSEESSFTEKNNGSKRSHKCSLCDKVFQSFNSLREHKKNHVGEKPLTCHICNKAFRQSASLTAHIQKHKDDDNLSCGNCRRTFTTKHDLRRHQQNVHCEDPSTTAGPCYECRKCKHIFQTLVRLEKHKEKCPGLDPVGIKKRNDSDPSTNVGRDLFKCVAPMTTTYWSDSFSE